MPPLRNGSYRNHCPECLWSRHLDITPGDRASTCRGPMRPERIDHKGGKGFVVVHCCTECGFGRPNKVADDDIDAVIALMSG